MADLARLVVALEAQTAKYQKELDRANRKLDRFGKTQTRLLNKVSSGFAAVGRAAGLAFAVIGASSLSGFIRQSAIAAEQLDLLADRLGVSARELQAWQLIGERFGVTQQSLSTGIQRLTRRSAEAAQGFGEAKDALKELGIDAAAFNRLSLDDRIIRLSSAFQGVATEADKVRLAFKLFDTEGVSFLQFLNEGESGLRRLRGELEGQIWSDEERQKLGDLNRKLTELGQKLRLAFAPPIVEAGNAVVGIIEKLQQGAKNLVNSFQLADAVRDGDKALQNVIRGKQDADAATAPPPLRAPGIAPRLEVAPPDFTKNRVDTEAVAQLVAYEEEFNAALDAQQRGFADFNDRLLREQAKRVEEQKRLDKEAEQNFVNLFAENMVQAAEFGFKSILRSWALTLQQMAAKAAASKIFQALGGSGGFFGSLFGGARAMGGPVSAGSTYLVVERGPELFTPRVSGTIIPNGGGGNVFNIDARGAVPGIEVRIKQAVQEAVALSRFDRVDSRKRGRA